MTVYNPTNKGDARRSADNGGNGSIYHGSATPGALTTSDKVRPVLIPGGTRVHQVVIKNTDLDSNVSPTLAANIGFANVDGSSGPSATAVASAATILQGAAETTYNLFPPVLLEKDAYLELVPTTGAATGASGTVYGKVLGEAVGMK